MPTYDKVGIMTTLNFSDVAHWVEKFVKPDALCYNI